MPTQVTLDPRIRALCEKVTAKRPKTVINHILKHGHITTEDLTTLYGYDHPPRAVMDVRDHGVPIVKTNTISKRTGRRIAKYQFGDPSEIKHGRIGGRRAFSKSFRTALIKYYNSRDALTGEQIDARYLQIDHRVPYEVAGDIAYDETRLEEYMLLDGSSQRTKSWSCEHCTNWKKAHDVTVCRSCFWAFPEDYTHIAGEQIRRVYIEWRGATEVAAFDRLRAQAQRRDATVAALLKEHIKGLA